METPRIAESISLVRDPQSPVVRMYVDGELFPYLIDGTDGMQPLLKLGRASGVTFTILARHVTVDDQYLVGVDLSHAHEDQGDQSP